MIVKYIQTDENQLNDESIDTAMISDFGRSNPSHRTQIVDREGAFTGFHTNERELLGSVLFLKSSGVQKLGQVASAESLLVINSVGNEVSVFVTVEIVSLRLAFPAHFVSPFALHARFFAVNFEWFHSQRKKHLPNGEFGDFLDAHFELESLDPLFHGPVAVVQQVRQLPVGELGHDFVRDAL